MPTPLLSRLRSLEELEAADPIRARYVRLLSHAAGGADPASALRAAIAGAPDRMWLPWYGGLVAHARRMAGAEPTELEAADPPAQLGGAGIPAASAAAWCEWAWGALARGEGARLSEVIGRQQASGAYFAFDGNAGDNPEPWWFHEVVMLHAITTHALLNGDAAALGSSRRAAAFHHAETQPDHATNQPWAVHAFLLDPEFTPTADLMLLAAGIAGAQRAEGPGPVSRLILADAAVCLSIA